MRRQWLLEHADVSICNQMSPNNIDGEALLRNDEASHWLMLLSSRSVTNDIGDIHGSHDYRMENILGKCMILGMNKAMPPFDSMMQFIIEYLHRHVGSEPQAAGFARIYHYRDQEKVLSCFLPMMGYHDDAAVLHIARKRIELLHDFTRQRSDMTSMSMARN